MRIQQGLASIVGGWEQSVVAILANQLGLWGVILGFAWLAAFGDRAGWASPVDSLSGFVGVSRTTSAAATGEVSRTANSSPTLDRQTKTKARLLAGAGLVALSLLVLAAALALVRSFKR
jgi:hypothetical protein